MNTEAWMHDRIRTPRGKNKVFSRSLRSGTLHDLIIAAIAGCFNPKHGYSPKIATELYERQQCPGCVSTVRAPYSKLPIARTVRWSVFRAWARRNAPMFFPSPAALKRWQEDEAIRRLQGAQLPKGIEQRGPNLWTGTLTDMVSFVLKFMNFNTGHGLNSNRIYELFKRCTAATGCEWRGPQNGGHAILIVCWKGFARWVRKNWQKFLMTEDEHEAMMKRVNGDFDWELNEASREMRKMEQEMQASSLDYPIDDPQIGLTARITRPLLEADIKIVEQLIAKSAPELLRIKGIGPQAVEQIQTALSAHNLQLMGDSELDNYEDKIKDLPRF